MEKKYLQLQSILLPTEDICNIPELYYHKQNSRIDYNGYFNLFYIEKRKKYTCIDNLSLNIELQGYHSLIIVHDGIDLEIIRLNANKLQEYKISFPFERYNSGCFWFALIESKETKDRRINGFFGTSLANENIREINIGLDICTFKREVYVFENLKRLKNKILYNSSLDVSSHVKIYIIDNGNTLQEHENIHSLISECEDKVRILPNKNTGGAGGFTRGMIEILNAKEQEHFTHVLLMDDDAIVEPDTIVRIYGLAVTLKKKWSNITIGGAMMLEEQPYIQVCAGEWWENGEIIKFHNHIDMRQYCMAADPYWQKTGDENNLYAAWWCCCYSLQTVRKDNLPIPLFIHHDDIEFGLRNSDYGTIFLNGICVWHKDFDSTFSGANRYYDVRNNLIEIALHQKKGKKQVAIQYLLKHFIVATIRLKYEDARLAYKGFKDFLKGPMWLYRQDAEKLNMRIHDMTYKFKPLKDLKNQLTEQEYISIKCQIKNYSCHRQKMSLLYYLSFNGWFLPAKKEIKTVLPPYDPFSAFRRKKVILYEPKSKKAMILKRDYWELLKMAGLSINIIFIILFRFDQIVEDYCTNTWLITNQKAWEKYLKI